MLKQLWNKFKTFWFSFGELKEPEDYFYLKDGVFIPYGKVKPDVELTHREVQQLRSLLKVRIEQGEGQVRGAKFYRNGYWDITDPSNPSTQVYFDKLNYWNDIVRDEKNNLKKLVNLQTKLKRLKGI
jgi:hypothetical protein